MRGDIAVGKILVHGKVSGNLMNQVDPSIKINLGFT